MNDRQQAFVHYYLQSFNITDAARRAGYKHPNVYGMQLMENEEIIQAIHEHMDKLRMQSAEVLVRLAQQARGSVVQFIGLTEKQIKEHPQAHLIKRIKPRELRSGKVVYDLEMYDSQSALSIIARHLNLFVDRHEHTGKDGNPIRVEGELNVKQVSDDLLAKLVREHTAGDPSSN